MFRLVRNTIFTFAVIGLTALGLEWNKDISHSRQPLSLEAAVLASQSFADVEAPVFPLTISFAEPAVKLGQTQQIIINTVPDAELDVVVLFPDGSVDTEHSTRATADGRGEYKNRFKISDFRRLGLFQVTAVAHSGNKTAEQTNRFIVNPWTSTPTSNTKYLYPLVP